MKKGFTLIETMIYIALLGIIMTSAFIMSYHLIQGTDRTNSKNTKEEEINFVIRKINWALTSIESITIPTASSQYSNTLQVIKYDGTVVDICLDSEKIKIREGGGVGSCNSNTFLPITTDNVKVSNLQFRYMTSVGLGAPVGITASTTINGASASTTKYLRK